MPNPLRRWTDKFTPVELITLSILISVASFGRLHQLPEKLIFATDQGRAMLAGRNILLGEWTLLGPETSVAGFHLGPFYYYLTALALWFSNFNPLGPAVMTALFGVGTTILLYLYGKRWWGFWPAVIMALAWALSPHAIWQSRIAIEPSPLPFFSILWLILMTIWWEKPRWLTLAGVLFTLFLAVQLNFSAVSLLIATAYLWWWRQSPISQVWKVRGLILISGSIIGLIVGHALARGTTSLQYFLRIWEQLTFPAFPMLAGLWLGLGLGTLYVLTTANRNRVHQPALLPLLGWFFLSLAGFLVKHVSGEHSLALLFPLPAILLGLTLFWLIRVRPHLLTYTSFAVALIILALSSYRYLSQQTTTWLSDHQQVTQHIIELSEGEPYNLVYRGHLDVYDAADDHYQYLLWQVGHPPNQSARIELRKPYFEQWLWETKPRANRTIYLYSSIEEAKRYPQQAKRIQNEQPVVFEVVDTPVAHNP